MPFNPRPTMGDNKGTGTEARIAKKIQSTKNIWHSGNFHSYGPYDMDAFLENLNTW